MNKLGKRLFKIVAMLLWGGVFVLIGLVLSELNSKNNGEFVLAFLGTIILGFIVGLLVSGIVLKRVKSWINVLVLTFVPLFILTGYWMYANYKMNNSAIRYVQPIEMIRHHGYYKQFMLTIAPQKGFEKCYFDSNESRSIIDQKNDLDDIRVWVIYTRPDNCNSIGQNKFIAKQEPSIKLWGNINKLDYDFTTSDMGGMERDLQNEFRDVDTTQIFSLRNNEFVKKFKLDKELTIFGYQSTNSSFTYVSAQVFEEGGKSKTMIYFKNLILRNGSFVHLDYCDELQDDASLRFFVNENIRIINQDRKYGSFLG